MQFCLINRQFSHTFRCFKKSNHFQNDFYEINAIFSKSKQTMSESKNTSNATEEDKHKSLASNERNKWSESGVHQIHPKIDNYQMNPNIGTSYTGAEVNPNSYSSNRPWVYQQGSFVTPVYGYPSFDARRCYRVGGQVIYGINGGFNHYTRPTYDRFANNWQSNRKLSQNSGSISDEKVRERVMRFREMIKTKYNDDIHSNEFRFSIMTYNILSQNLLEDHSDLYQHCQKSALSWPERGHRIVRELLDSDCDIICLQEVHSQHFEQLLMPALREGGYNSMFKQRTGGKMDGCAIVYKEKKFSLLNSIKLDFMRTDLSSLLDRDNIALIAVLKPKQWERHSNLIVANTHLLYNPKRGDVKLAQMRLLMAEIDKIAQISRSDGVFDYNPVILCGDLNSAPNSLLFDFITKGSANFNNCKVGDISGQRGGFGRGRPVEDYHLKLLGVTADTRFKTSSDSQAEEDQKMAIKHNFKLKSVIMRFSDKNDNKLISSSNYLESALVDYIFYNYSKLKVCAFQRLLTDYQMEQIGNIPNNILGSDHLSIKAIFSII